MPLITSAGVGSGLDLEAIISASVQAEDAPKIAQFNETDARLNVELSAVGAIKSSLSALDDITEKLADIDNFNKRTATLTQPESGDLISVSTNDNSTPGTFNIEVSQLAQGSRAVGNTAFTATTDVVSASAGNLTYTAGADTFTISLAGGETLEELRTAINEASDNFGVTANIVNDGTNSKLVLTSSTTGAGNDLVVTNDNAALDDVSTVANGGGAGGLSIATDDQAQDGIIIVDGITINSDSNTFTDAVQDLTITALKESDTVGETSKLVVDYDKSGVEELINEFIEGFNNVIETIDYHTAIGAGLSGDSSMRGLKSQMVNALSSTVTGAGNFETLYDIGIGLSKDGLLEKDSLVRSLSDAMSSSFDDVGTIFTASDGIGTQFAELFDDYLDSDGALTFRIDNLNSELKDLDTDKANHDYRMTQLEDTLRQKYSALDVLVAQLKSSGSFLSGQLDSLPGFTSS